MKNCVFALSAVLALSACPFDPAVAASAPEDREKVVRLNVENVADADLGDLVKARAEHGLTLDDVKSRQYECRFVFRNLNGDTCERIPDVFDGGYAAVALDAVDLPAGENALTCVLRRAKETNALSSVTATFRRVERPVVRTRQTKPGEPFVIRLGTTAVDEVESNPILFKGVPYVFEHARWGKMRMRRYPDLSVVLPKYPCSLQMPCAFVAKDRVYVTGTRRDREDVHGTYLIESDDLANWTPAREIVSNLTRIAYNTTMTKADGRYVLATERAPAKGEKVTNAGYQMTFAESTDLKTWRVIPDTTYVGNAGSPCLRFHAGWFYFFSLTAFSHTPEGNPVYSMQVARSRDLKAWETSKRHVLDPVHEDRRPYPGVEFTAAERVRMMSAECRNASDIDMCEYKGDLIITYSWGNQRGNEFLALGLVRGMTERAFCESFFSDLAQAGEGG